MPSTVSHTWAYREQDTDQCCPLEVLSLVGRSIMSYKPCWVVGWRVGGVQLGVKTDLLE